MLGKFFKYCVISLANFRLLFIQLTRMSTGSFASHQLRQMALRRSVFQQKHGRFER